MIGPRPAPGRPGFAQRQVGFTLLEVMMVLVLGAIIYAVLLSAPLGKVTAADLKAAARTLASGLRTAQTSAMSTRRDALLTLDVDSREFVLSGDSQARKLPDGIELKLYTAQTEVASERRGSIRFYPDGSSTGGRITVASGERKFLVDVDWLTGRVSIGE
jgi:general secretion pathway protein H